MVKTSKVVGFLDFTNTEQGWDPTLMFVMGSALLVATPGYQLLGLATNKVDREVAQWSKRPINAVTVFSGALFGAGWGLSGLCPGPVMTNATSSNDFLLSQQSCSPYARLPARYSEKE